MSLFGWLFSNQDHFDSLGPEASVYPLSAGLEALHAAGDAAYFDAELLPALSRGRRIICSTVASLPVAVWRDGQPLEPTPALVRRPDPFTFRYRFLYETADSMLRGDAFWELTALDDFGHPTNMHVLPRRLVRVEWADERRSRRRYFIDNQAVGSDEIAHIPFDPQAGRLLGRSPLDSHLLALMAAAEDEALGWFNGEGEPIGNLHSAAELESGEARALAADWNEARRSSRVGVTSGGLTYNRVGVDPSEAQLLETRRHHVTEAARLLGIPAPLLLAEVQGAGILQYANIGQLFTELIRTTVQPEYLTPLEAAWSAAMPRGQEVRFDTTMLDRPDTAARFAAYALGIQHGFLNTDEVRQWEGLTGAAERTPPAVEAAPNPEVMSQ